MEHIPYLWSDLDQDILNIKQQIIQSSWIPDFIVGVKRGGLIPAIKLSHMFDKPLIMMSCQLRDSTDHEVRLYEVNELPKDKNILIVDDICDSGITLSKIILEFIANGFNIDNIKTSSLIFNTNQKFIIDYYATSIDRASDHRWIIFPWEDK